MKHKKYLLVTGAAGFISSVLIQWLNTSYPEYDIIAVDDFSVAQKQANFIHKKIHSRIHRDTLFDDLHEISQRIALVFHLGARTDTTEQDTTIFNRLNLHYSQQMWQFCSRYEIPLVYASSAATYGLGEYGYEDDNSLPTQLRPLNPYGHSKNEFDIWTMLQSEKPPHWYGLKFFNVYGPNEYHKRRMASVVFHAYKQIEKTGQMNLFMSHRDDIAHGHQARDFIYVMDVVKMCLFFMDKLPESGLYNIGSGEARTFLDLVNAVFNSLQLESKIEFVPTPVDIRDTYQYFTEAGMDKLRRAGYTQKITSLEEGVHDYVQNYLKKSTIY